MAIMTPGAFFLGTLTPSEQRFVKNFLESARKRGYRRVVEPCAGAFALSHLAVQAGFKPEQIETSDVTLFSSIYGYAIMGKPLDDLEIIATGFDSEELSDPAVALYALMLLKTQTTSGSDYFFAMLKDLEEKREYHIAKIREQIERAKTLLCGMNYRPMDMFEHIDEVKDDEKTIILANPPTYKAGFEKWYDTGGNMTWKEPAYNIFDPVTGIRDLMVDRLGRANALVLCYEENAMGCMAGYPLFARYGVVKGKNVYLTTNKPEEAEDIAGGKIIVRPQEREVKPLDCSMLPTDYDIRPDCTIGFMVITPAEATYYRSMWTHNFAGSASQINIGLFIDGQIAGVFGYQIAIGGVVFKEILIMYGITIPHDRFRVNRLLTMIATNKDTLRSVLTDYQLSRLTGVQTVQMTKYPESKEMRGVMKMTKREKGKLGFKLYYRSDINERTKEQTLIDWHKREEQWMKERKK